MSDLKSLAHSLLNFKGYASWVKRLQEVDTELDQLRAENDRLNDLLKTHKVLENFKSYEKCAAENERLRGEVEAKEARIVQAEQNALNLSNQLESKFAGVLAIRCIKHVNVPQLNKNESSGGECPICEVEKLQREIKQLSGFKVESNVILDDLAHHKQLLVEAKEALNFIYDDADFESLEEEARIYPVLMKVLAHINQALGETTPPTSTEK